MRLPARRPRTRGARRTGPLVCLLLGGSLALGPHSALAATAPNASTTPSAAADDTSRTQRADEGLARGVDNWWFDGMGLAKVQRRTIGEGVQVAIIDGGIWTKAPDLAGIDLTVHQVCTPSPVTDNVRGGSHGAGMVATLAGQGTRSDGRPGLRGVAPGVSVHYYGSRDVVASARKDCEAEQLIAAVDDGADIVSSSQRWYAETRPMEQALAYAAEAGVVVVKSAGNAGQDRDMREDGPKPGVVLVTQVDREGVPQGNVAPVISPYGSTWNAVSAPGWEATGSGFVPGQGWVSGAEFSGTSNAAPVVAGQLALQKSIYPDATGNQLIQSLIHDTTNTDWEWLRGYGFGIAAITAMMERDPTGWPDVNPLVGTRPEQVLRRYPPDIYGTAEATDAGGSASAAPSPTPAQSPDSTPTAPSDDSLQSAASADTASSAGDGGAPGWVWPLVGVGVLTLAGLVVLLARRRAGATSAGRG